MFDSGFDLVFTLVHRGIFATILTVFVTIGLAAFGVPVIPDAPSSPPLAPVPEELVRGRIEAEIEAAEELGFVESRRIAITRESTAIAMSLEDGECVALVGGTWGPRTIRSIAVLPSTSATLGDNPTPYRDEALAADPSVSGLVAALQWCGGHAGELTAEVLTRSPGAIEEAEFGGEVVLLRARPAGVGSLNRGYVLRPR